MEARDKGACNVADSRATPTLLFIGRMPRPLHHTPCDQHKAFPTASLLLLPLGRRPGLLPSDELFSPTPAAPSQKPGQCSPQPPHAPINQTKTSPCLDPNQDPVSPRMRSKLLSVAPEGPRSSPTLAALSQHSICLPVGIFGNTHSGLLAPSTLHTLFPPFRCLINSSHQQALLPASSKPPVLLPDTCQRCLGRSGPAQWRH